jgi:hypothetical protein
VPTPREQTHLYPYSCFVRVVISDQSQASSPDERMRNPGAAARPVPGFRPTHPGYANVSRIGYWLRAASNPAVTGRVAEKASYRLKREQPA